MTFDPFELDVTVTSDRVRQAVSDNEYLTGVMLAFRLNELSLVCHAVQHVPPTHSRRLSHLCRSDDSSSRSSNSSVTVCVVSL